MEMLANIVVIFILQYINVSKQHVVHLISQFKKVSCIKKKKNKRSGLFFLICCLSGWGIGQFASLVKINLALPLLMLLQTWLSRSVFLYSHLYSRLPPFCRAFSWNQSPCFYLGCLQIFIFCYKHIPLAWIDLIAVALKEERGRNLDVWSSLSPP